MKEYPVTRDYRVYDVYEAEYGSYVRVNGDVTSNEEEAYNNGYVRVHLYKSDDDWIEDWNSVWLTSISPDENGEYLGIPIGDIGLVFHTNGVGDTAGLVTVMVQYEEEYEKTNSLKEEVSNKMENVYHQVSATSEVKEI